MALGFSQLEAGLLDGLLLLDKTSGEERVKNIKRFTAHYFGYRKKFMEFRQLAKAEFARLGEQKHLKDLEKVCIELRLVAKCRNELMHSFWTTEIKDGVGETGRLKLFHLGGRKIWNDNPSPENIQDFADRIWGVRKQLGDLVKSYSELLQAANSKS